MTTDLRFLVYSAVLLAVLILFQAGAAMRVYGLPALAGNRDDLPPPPPYVARAKRVVSNHIEGLVVFATILLAAAVAHISNRWTVLGSELYFWGRVAHAGLYLAGVPFVRTLAFGVAVAGMVLVLGAALGALA